VSNLFAFSVSNVFIMAALYTERKLSVVSCMLGMNCVITDMGHY